MGRIKDIAIDRANKKAPTGEAWIPVYKGNKLQNGYDAIKKTPQPVPKNAHLRHFGGNSKKGTVTWFTPKYLIDQLGPFDLDPCTHKKRPFSTAVKHYTVVENGLIRPWHGVVFCNPPYDDIPTWLALCAKHKAAIALVFNRTETNWFDTYIWQRAYAVNFVKGRIPFLELSGKPGKGGPGAGSVLVAYNKATAKRIQKVPGVYIEREQWLNFNPF